MCYLFPAMRPIEKFEEWKGAVIGMKRRRTMIFKRTFLGVGAICSVFLGWFAFFGISLAETHFQTLADGVFSILAIAVGSLLLFSFFPYFRGDKRWYSISALLTVAFFVGTVILWQAPVTGGIY